jgi:hypothetical protein
VPATRRDGPIHAGAGCQFIARAGHHRPSNSGLRPQRHFAALGLLLATPILALSGSAEAAIIKAATASQSDVSAGIASAANGDTVAIPAGTASWTQNFSINKAITLKGAGVGLTIIIDSIPNSIPQQHLMSWRLVANKESRMTGIEFQGNPSARPTPIANGVITIDGKRGANVDNRTMRIDHCKFNQLCSDNIMPVDMVGVIDHNEFVFGTTNCIGIYSYQKHWNGAADYGDGSWNAPSNFGSDQFLFIEDNTFTRPVGHHYAVIDGSGGARWVFRHNTVTRGWLEAHGTESGGRNRGTRAIEVYNNTFQSDNYSGIIANIRSGTGVIHDNIASGYPNANFSLRCHRMFYPFPPWGTADGTNQWDVNLAGSPFYSGTASSSRTLRVTVSGTPWTTNQWIGYSIKKTSNLATVNAAEIVSNTHNTITFTGGAGYVGGNLTFAAGDTFQIWKVLQALDQPGRARGSLITGVTPVLPGGWNDQITEPFYEWNNTHDGGVNVNFIAADKNIRQNEHFFNDTAMPGYTPYTYPHPLTTAVSPSLPTTLNATSSSSDNLDKKKKQWAKKLERKIGKKAKQNSTNERAEGQENLDE